MEAERYSSSDKEVRMRKSLDNISNNITNLAACISATENALQRDNERDKLLYLRERERLQKHPNKNMPDIHPRCISLITSKKSVIKSPVFNIRKAQEQLKKTQTPKRRRSSCLYFDNGKIGCLSAEQCASNKVRTLEIVKDIIEKERMYPLVAEDDVQKVLANKLEATTLTATETTSLDIKESVDELHFELQENGNGIDNQDFSFHDESPIANVTFLTDEHDFVKNRLKHIVRRFSDRSRNMRELLDHPITPITGSTPQVDAIKLFENNDRITTRINIVEVETNDKFDWISPIICGSEKSGETAILNPQGHYYITWLFIVILSFLYNCWVIPLRSSFPFQTPDNITKWITMDIIADFIYLLDILLFKHRLIYLEEGFWVKDKTLARKNYLTKLQFKLDVLALLPLDLLYLKLGTQAVWLRSARFLKIQSFWEFFKLLDQVVASPHFLRIIKTLTYMLFMIHGTACLYYVYSAYQGIGTNRWVYSGKGHPYVRCFVFATKTATSIGKNPKPENEGELVFMTVAWLSGVFVFALLIGQIRDIIATATKQQTEYKKLLDETLQYMRHLNLPDELQNRVKMWFSYTWDQQRSLDESNIIDTLPQNLKTDIALSVHIKTLSKVKLFADCEEAFLKDLVLLMRSLTFLPGDFVCRKGNVGKEMYIIKSGEINVMGGKYNDQILVTLSEGSVFGEISLLAINGTNRRTAYVQSKGYSNLFVLSKSDLNEVIVYYPNAQALLKERANNLMTQDKTTPDAKIKISITDTEPDIVIGTQRTIVQPRLLKTVLQVLPAQSPTAQFLTHGSKNGCSSSPSARRNTDGHAEFEEVFQINRTDSEKALEKNGAIQCNK